MKKRARILRGHASLGFNKAEPYSGRWLFWRGVLLGIESSTRSGKFVTPDWADLVAHQIITKATTLNKTSDGGFE